MKRMLLIAGALSLALSGMAQAQPGEVLSGLWRTGEREVNQERAAGEERRIIDCVYFSVGADDRRGIGLADAI